MRDDKHKYTVQDARAEVANSTDWEIARLVSIKKWTQIATQHDWNTYAARTICGYCLVLDNRIPRAPGCLRPCHKCPARHICITIDLTETNPHDMVTALASLKHPEEATP